MPPERTIEL
jgi:hypothetical protein